MPRIWVCNENGANTYLISVKACRLYITPRWISVCAHMRAVNISYRKKMQVKRQRTDRLNGRFKLMLQYRPIYYTIYSCSMHSILG